MVLTEVDIPECTSIQDIHETILQDEHLQELKVYIIQG